MEQVDVILCDHCGLDHEGRCPPSEVFYFLQLRDFRGFVTHEAIWRFYLSDDDMAGVGLLGHEVVASPSAHDDHLADPVPSVWELLSSLCIDPVAGREMPYMSIEPVVPDGRGWAPLN